MDEMDLEKKMHSWLIKGPPYPKVRTIFQMRINCPPVAFYSKPEGEVDIYW
jgi:hypothetical protein